MNSFRKLVCALLTSVSLSACATEPPTIQPVSSVDLDRYMGAWYVIAHVPSRGERQAWQAVETYSKNMNGSIATVYRYRNGSFQAPEKTIEPVGFVRPGTRNAVWDVQFYWPLRAEYVIVDLAPDYSHVVVARSKRDYAWIMARTPTMPVAEYEASVAKLQALGYDVSKIRKVPQLPE